MSLSLPNLDDRRWSDLVEEGRALIPLFEESWSDHNVHDPGIMLMELLAWITEMDIYWLNRIPDNHLRRFLDLIGLYLTLPQPARTVLQILLNPDADVWLLPDLPAGLQFEGEYPQDESAVFRSLHTITLAPGQLQAVQRLEENHWHDLTNRYQRGETFSLFGSNPKPGATAYFGFTDPFPACKPVTLYFTFADSGAGYETRERLFNEHLHHEAACNPPCGLIDCPQCLNQAHSGRPGDLSTDRKPWQHHSVNLTWEYLNAAGNWQELDRHSGGVWDDTRAATLNGRIVIRIPGEMKKCELGEVHTPLHYLRCRQESGYFDAPPRVHHLAFNGVLVEQAANLETLFWQIAPQAVINGPEPERGRPASFNVSFDQNGWITHLHFTTEGPPEFQVQNYRRPQNGQSGQLRLAVKKLQNGDGRPWQRRSVSKSPTQTAGLRLVTWEAGQWRTWQAVSTLNASSPTDAHFVLDASTGELLFGDGQRGSVLPKDAWPLLSYRTTRAENAELPADTVTNLMDNFQNRALIAGSLQPLVNKIMKIGNPKPATGGKPAETLLAAISRALSSREQSQRAVTLDDYRSLAKGTPGVKIARVAAFANRHPAFPCMSAPGVITVIVLPFLPSERPMPSPGLLKAVSAYLNLRRILGTQVAVVAPKYTSVKIKASVSSHPGINLAGLGDRISAELDRFFHPLDGGPENSGWPFGRDIFRSEVLALIDEVNGVDHVSSLELVSDDGEPTCGNLCLGPLGLPAAGEHQIEAN